MTAYLRDARRAVEAAEREHREATDAAREAYERREKSRKALTDARTALEIARLFPDGPPLRVGQRVAARPGYGPGTIVDVYLGNRAHGVRPSPDDLTATVQTDEGYLYPMKSARTKAATS